MNEAIVLEGLHKSSSKIHLDVNSISDVHGSSGLPNDGEFVNFLKALEAFAEPGHGQYNIFTILESDYDWTSYDGIINEIRPCTRNQLLVLDKPLSLDRAQAFQNKFVDELLKPMPDPVFGLGGELPIRFTLLAIDNATIDADGFRKDFENFKSLADTLHSFLPIRAVFQVSI